MAPPKKGTRGNAGKQARRRIREPGSDGTGLQFVRDPAEDVLHRTGQRQPTTWRTRASSRSRGACFDTGYRTRLWTMRQYAGYATAEESNERFRYLLEQGQTGLSVAFDLPTQMGYDSDHPWHKAKSERSASPSTPCEDMEFLLAKHPLGSGHDFDDHQRARSDPARHVRGGCRKAGRLSRKSLAARYRTTS